MSPRASERTCGPPRAEAAPPEELVGRARGGDGDAWAALTRRYTGMLWAIARSHGLSQSDAADVVQTAWLRLVERLDALRDPRRVGAWLAVTTAREAERARLRSVQWPPDGAVRPAAAERTPEGVWTARERLRRVAGALEELPERCRRLLRLFAASPSYADAAAALGMPVGSIGPTRARCLSALRQRLGDDF
ncbi:RNA polymerase sigma factor [Actinomadura sp. NBRC 104425]|uniref:RNA polymerase sigma factor n=1 Tax=Actinomadura sp. NBRC 104425 TaxID=3032204 RepID=UPI0024A031E4|nr:sigma-70 family RNA polymerase sigma factor [Actinomadura sp. NBRC 104425]GLZ14229.1 RNA polymerase sigma factor [Actinomadura sp. NBRC 104425]